jgi:hypothetical protein
MRCLVCRAIYADGMRCVVAPVYFFGVGEHGYWLSRDEALKAYPSLAADMTSIMALVTNGLIFPLNGGIRPMDQ